MVMLVGVELGAVQIDSQAVVDVGCEVLAAPPLQTCPPVTSRLPAGQVQVVVLAQVCVAEAMERSTVLPLEIVRFEPESEMSCISLVESLSWSRL